MVDQSLLDWLVEQDVLDVPEAAYCKYVHWFESSLIDTGNLQDVASDERLYQQGLEDDQQVGRVASWEAR